MKSDEKIKILQDVIKINSINGNEEAVADYLMALLKKNGIESKKVGFAKNRTNLVADLKLGEGKTIALSGHMDTVDIGNVANWTYPPFDAKIDGNKLYGRGSTDMKSGLCAAVIAMIELKEQNVSAKGTVRLMATVGEEVGELGAAALTQKGYADDIDALVIGEPTHYHLLYAHKGSIDYTVNSIGKAAHSSMPQLGSNAINHLNLFMNDVIFEMDRIAERYENDELGRTIHQITVINGGDQVNSIPAFASLKGNIRTIPEYGNDKVNELLAMIVEKLNRQPEVRLELKVDYDLFPVKNDPNSPLIRLVKDINKARSGGDLDVVTASGTTDVAEFIKAKRKFDFVVFGPGITNLAHQVNEYVEIDKYLDIIEIYAEICKRYLA